MKHDHSRHKILDYLKHEGPSTAVSIGKAFGMTSMGARQHLEHMMKDGLVEFNDKRLGVGRPKKLWYLTENARHYFPDKHDQLSAEMLISVKAVFGENGIERLVQHREDQVLTGYKSKIDRLENLEDKIKALVKIRTEEGYMASYRSVECGFLFIENHCPICVAATHCKQFCQSELEVFKQLLAPLAKVQRTEHIIKGARRCAYLICYSADNRNNGVS